MQKFKVFALTSQAAIDAVANRESVVDFITWSFDSNAEVEAYILASNVLRDEAKGLHSFHMEGTTTIFEVLLDGGDVVTGSRTFKSYLECRAFQIGLRDFSGRNAWTAVKSADGNDFAHLQSIENAREAKIAAADAESRPTIVIYKSADQITRIVASQSVRVIVLDSDGVGLEEDAPRTLQIDDQELYVSDLIVTGKVGESQYGEQGVDENFVRQVVQNVQSLSPGSNVDFNKPGQYAEPFPTLKSVPVKHWGSYEDKDAPLTHQIDIEDQRLPNGQVYLTVGALEGHLDNLLSVTAEVTSSPNNEAEHLPCMRVHFNESAPAFTVFKSYDKIMLRPEEGVVLTAENGPDGLLYIVE